MNHDSIKVVRDQSAPFNKENIIEVSVNDAMLHVDRIEQANLNMYLDDYIMYCTALSRKFHTLHITHLSELYFNKHQKGVDLRIELKNRVKINSRQK